MAGDSHWAAWISTVKFFQAALVTCQQHQQKRSRRGTEAKCSADIWAAEYGCHSRQVEVRRHLSMLMCCPVTKSWPVRTKRHPRTFYLFPLGLQ